MSTPAKSRAPAHSLKIEPIPAPPMDDFDRWLAQYVAAIARLEGIPVPTSQVA